MVDYVDVQYFSIFNLADAALTLSAIGIAVLALKGVPMGPIDDPAAGEGHDASSGPADQAPGPAPRLGVVTDSGSTRSLPVPDGLDAERVDAGLARLLGLSRTKAAELAATGQVLLDGSPVGKSDRLVAGSWLEVTLPPEPAAFTEVVAEPVPGMRIVYDDEDLVVVDKPVGVAAHPSPGGPAPPSSAAWRQPATGSRRAVPRAAGDRAPS